MAPGRWAVVSTIPVGTQIFFRDIGYRNKHLPPVLADIFSRRSRIFFRAIINPHPSVYARLSGRLSYAMLMLRGSLGWRGCCMAKESEEAGFGQSSAGEGEPPDTHAEKHLRKFLHDLGRLSTHYGLWIENTPLGTTVSQRADALGYHAWARAGGDQVRVYELDCHGPGDASVAEDHTPDGRHVIIGGDQARLRPTGSGSEETASTQDGASRAEQASSWIGTGEAQLLSPRSRWGPGAASSLLCWPSYPRLDTWNRGRWLSPHASPSNPSADAA